MNIDHMISTLSRGELPNKRCISELIELATSVLDSEPNVLRLEPPITICGDSHGQLYDVLHLFEVVGQPGETRYLFLGDYVDRGYYSIELICLLLCFKVKYQHDFFLLRGNHETRAVCEEYGFLAEVNAKLGDAEIWRKFTNLFDYLPIVAIVDSRLFCVHGGLDPSIETVAQIERIDRRKEPELTSGFAGLLWSDPSESVSDWKRSNRRAGYLFNRRLTNEFLQQNGLQMVVRSHELVDGYKKMFNDKLVTVWGAPNYCYLSGNRGSCLRVESGEVDVYFVYDPMPDARRKKPPQALVVQYYA